MNNVRVTPQVPTFFIIDRGVTPQVFLGTPALMGRHKRFANERGNASESTCFWCKESFIVFSSIRRALVVYTHSKAHLIYFYEFYNTLNASFAGYAIRCCLFTFMRTSETNKQLLYCFLKMKKKIQHLKFT